MAATPAPQFVVADATKWTGPATMALSAGEVTCTLLLITVSVTEVFA